MASAGEPQLLEDGASDGRALVVLAHGAGAGMRSDFMTFVAGGLAAAGFRCLRFEFPYMQAGRKTPDKSAVLEDVYRRVAGHARELAGERPVVLGGKSMGGRIASQAVAAGAPADAARFCAAALEEGVLVEATAPPALGEGGARVRMAVMASHTRAELVGAAVALDRALGRAARPEGDVVTPWGADVQEGGIFDVQARLAA